MRAQKAVGQRLVFAQQAQQQVLRLYIRRAELAGLVSCKEDYAPGFLCVPLEHIPLTQMLPVTSAGNISLSFWLRTAHPPERSLSVLPATLRHKRASKCCAGQTYHLPYRQKNLKPSPSPRPLIQRCGRHFLSHAMMQPQYTIAAARKLKVVGDDKGSEPVLLVQSLYQSEYHFRCTVIQVSCWLVRHQDSRSRYQGPGQRYPLLLTAGKFSRAMMTAALQSNFPQPSAGFLHGLTVCGSLH